MPQPSARYTAARPAGLADGWIQERIAEPSRLYGANGVRTGADGRIYVAQVSGSQISAIDIETGAIEAISPMGGDIVGPDDLAFDSEGNLYATEITEGRVSVRAPNGTTRVLQGDMPVANPITFHEGRLIVGECRVGGRIMELDLNGGAPRMILDNVPMPNAFSVGPDGKLYTPVMGTNEIWRVGLEGGTPEKVAGDLGVPDSVKFDRQGFIISTQVMSGQVLRIDPRTGDRTVLANLTPGLDNSTFVGNRLFVSNINGSITEILDGGKTKDLITAGFNFPLGLAMGAEGVLFVADGPFCYTLRPGDAASARGLSVRHRLSRVFPRCDRGGRRRIHRHDRERRGRALLARAAEKRSARARIRSAVRRRHRTARSRDLRRAGCGPRAFGAIGQRASARHRPQAALRCRGRRRRHLLRFRGGRRPRGQDIRRQNRHSARRTFEAARHRGARRIALHRRCRRQGS